MMKIWEKHRKRQWIGFYSGSYLAVALAVIGLSGLFMSFNEKGPMNTGHENLKCADCHRAAPGSLRQQLQAKVRYGLNTRETDAVFGHFPAANEDCLFCHKRPDDPHPVYRFIEPRFVEARKELHPQYCVSCHEEHTGKRITIQTDFCKHCHEKLVLKNDPLDIPHEKLIADEKWTGCLGCHDYHGNHVYKTPVLISELIPYPKITGYFQGEPSPYSQEKKHEPLKEKN